MNLHAELNTHAKEKDNLKFFEDSEKLRRVPLDELQIIKALFPLVRANFRKSWANIESWEYKTLANTKVDEWDYSILLSRDDRDYSIKIKAPSRSADFYKTHNGELHDDKVADLIDEVEKIVEETILEKQKKIMRKA